MKNYFYPSILPLLHCLNFLFFTSSALAQENNAVKQDFQVAIWGASCMACHGTDGRASGVGKTIGGMAEQEMYAALIGFKNGTRPSTIMHHHTKGYTEDQLKRISKYFSSIKQY